MKNAPTLEDFCEAANDLYAAPTEERFYVVVNLARDVIQTNQAKWDDGYKFGRSEVEKLQTAALLALGLLWMTERQSDKVHRAYTTLRDALGGKEALREGIQAAMDAGHEADHPHGADWWAGKKQAADGVADTHTDHPQRHYDRTCPACNPSGVEGRQIDGEQPLPDLILQLHRAGLGPDEIAATLARLGRDSEADSAGISIRAVIEEAAAGVPVAGKEQA